MTSSHVALVIILSLCMCLCDSRKRGQRSQTKQMLPITELFHLILSCIFQVPLRVLEGGCYLFVQMPGQVQCIE